MKKTYQNPTMIVLTVYGDIILQTQVLSSPEIKPGTGPLPDEGDSKFRDDTDWGNLW